MVKETNTQNKTGSSTSWLLNRKINKLKFTAMNKKFFIVSVVTLLLGTTSVMADNHRGNDGPQKPKKEVVQKNKKDNKNDRHLDSKAKHNAPKPQAAKPAPKPQVVAHKAPAKHKPAPNMHHPKPKPMPKPGCGPDVRHGKSCHYCHRCHHHHVGHCRPVAPRRPIKNHVRITPPFSPIQVTVRI